MYFSFAEKGGWVTLRSQSQVFPPSHINNEHFIKTIFDIDKKGKSKQKICLHNAYYQVSS